MQSLYTASATANGGRNGTTRNSNGVIDLTLSTPKSMGGPGKEGATTPEDLFAAGYAGCFGSAVDLIGKMQKLNVDGMLVTARVSIGKNDSGGFGLAVELDVTLPQLERAAAEKLVAEAHKICPYSNATRNNVDVAIKVL